jgi:glycosyltransferase involved in cell wall biosynthesis
LPRLALQVAALKPDVLHGHGAKAAALVRLTPYGRAIRVYTPHGGSLHYDPATFAGRVYCTSERLLSRRTDLFLFESSFAADALAARVGRAGMLARVVHNGVGAPEFAPVTIAADAADLICVGELRAIKGIDTLIEALALLKRGGRTLSAAIAGEGPDAARFRELVRRRGIADQVRFLGYRPARMAFAMGKVVVVPSHAESLPYIVLEAAAAAMPIIATRVGGVPEIFGEQACYLVPAGNVAALAAALAAAFNDPEALHRRAAALHAHVRRDFSVDAMVEGVLGGYREAMSKRECPKREGPKREGPKREGARRS